MATILRGYRTELDLNCVQRAACLRHAGAARWAYNYGLKRKQDALEDRKVAVGPVTFKIPTAIDLHNEIIALKHGENPWLKQVSKWAPQQALRNLDSAFANFFANRAKYPRPKKRSKGIGSFYLEAPIHVGVDWVQLPVLGTVRLFEHGYIPQDSEVDKPDRKAEKKRQRGRRDLHAVVKYKYRSAVISEQAGRWFVSVLVQETSLDPVPATGEPVGVDLGVKVLAVCSDGRVVANPKALKTNLKRLRRAQRRQSRRKKGSQNRQKAKQQVAKIHYRVGCLRKNALHQATARITAKTKPPFDRPAAIILEDLHVTGLLKNHKLALAIADVGLGEFRRQMTYKSSWYGNTLVLAHPFFPSTQLCSVCHRLPFVSLGLNIRTYHCEHCGSVVDRDRNAAHNLAWLYTASPAEIDACGEIIRPEVLVPRAVSLKQEPNTK